MTTLRMTQIQQGIISAFVVFNNVKLCFMNLHNIIIIGDAFLEMVRLHCLLVVLFLTGESAFKLSLGLEGTPRSPARTIPALC